MLCKILLIKLSVYSKESITGYQLTKLANFMSLFAGLVTYIYIYIYICKNHVREISCILALRHHPLFSASVQSVLFYIPPPSSPKAYYKKVDWLNLFHVQVQ